MKIDIWSDVVCPWCAIGKANLEAALGQFEHADEVQVVWRSFELDPNAPPVREGDYTALLARKYRTTASHAAHLLDQLTRTGADAGVELRFDRVRPGNTFDAHRLLHLAAARGLQGALKTRLLRAYLAEGEAIGDPATLTRLALEVGLDADEVGDVLGSQQYAAAVRADEEEARRLEVSGVPLFLVDGRFMIPGAQAPDVIVRTLRRAWERSRPVVITGGEVCGPDGCAD